MSKFKYFNSMNGNAKLLILFLTLTVLAFIMSLFYQRITLLYILCICLFFNELTWSQSLSPVLPKANSLIAGKQVQFRWNGQTTAKGYELQISTDSTFSSVEYSLNNISSTGCKQTLSLYGKYYWRFRANYGTTTSNWSRTSSFNSFEPIQYASLNMWLAADSGLVTDANAKLSTWLDLSGKNNSLTQANASERPSIQTGLNNLPAVHFDGVDDQMLSANAIKVGTVFSLFNWTGTSPLPDYNGVMTALGGSNEVFFIGTQGSTSLYSAGYFASQVFVNQTQTLDLAPLSNYKILSGVQPSPISTFNGIRLASDRNFGGRFWNGNFLENLVFDTILTPTQYTAVYNYLSYKYAPPVDLGPDKIVCSLPITLKASKNYFTSYTWNNATTADSLVINAPGTYALTTTDIFNKTTSDTIVISQDVAAYTVNLGNDISICQGQQVVLTAGDAHLTYVWSTGATSNSIVVDSTAVYSVTVTDCLGNITNDAILVTVAPLPEFSLGADTLFCYNAAYKLSTGLDASVPGTYSFLWSDASIDSILVPQASGNFSVKVTDAIGCIFADSIHVTIDSLLYTVSLGPDTAFCSGNYIQLSQGAANVQTYLWSDSSTLPTLQVNQPTGVYTYSVVVSNSNACQKSDTIVVSVSGVAPQINFSNTASICFGDTVFFTDLSVPQVGDTISAYSWEFGDNSTSQMQHPTHLYAAAGDYIVKLTVLASNGCSASISKTITVHPLPIADFTSSVAYALSAVQFTNTSQLFLNPLQSWEWNFGDNSSAQNNSSLQNPQHIYSSAGSYSVSLIVTTAYGCSDTTSKPLLVNESLPTTLVYPKNNQVLPAFSKINFEWDAVNQSKNYELVIASDSLFTNLVYNNASITTTQYNYTLVNSGYFYWKVRYYIGAAASSWSMVYKFKLEDLSSVTGLQSWLKADSGLVMDAQQRISKWTDMSGNNHHALQSTPALKPTKQIGINELPSVSLDGVDDELFIPDTFEVGQVFSVFNWNGANLLPDYNGLLTAVDGNDVFFIGTTASTSLYSAGFFATNVFVNEVQTLDIAPLNSYKIINGYTATTPFVYSGIRIGRDRTNPDRFWNGNISEVLVFDTVLSSDKSKLVYDYLSYKYAPPVNLGANRTVCSFPFTLHAQKNYFKTYTWQDTTNADSIVIAAPGKYYLTTTDIFNKISSDTIEIIQDTSSYAVKLINDTTLCEGVEFTVLAGPSHLSYQWNTGAQQNSLAIDTSGLYTVSLIDCKGNLSLDSIYVNFNALPVFDLGNDTVVCYNQFFKLSTTLVNPQPNYYQFNWSTNSHDSILIPTQSGNYYLTVKDPIGCTFSDTVNIKMDSLLYLSSLGNDTSFCSGNYIQLQQGADSVSHYLWSDGTSQTSLEVVQPIGANYLYWLEMEDSYGCKKRDTIYVTIAGVAPQIAYTFDTAVCIGSSMQFTDFSQAPSGETIVSWEWNFGDTTVSSLQNPSHLYATAGSYLVRLKITSSGGCSAILTKTVKVHPFPLVAFTHPSSCAYNETQFTNTSNTYGNLVQNYQWNFGDPASGSANFSNLANPKHIFTARDTFTVQFSITTIYGCADTAFATIITKPSPVASFSDTLACEGYSVNLLDNSTYPFPQYNLSRSWNFNDGSPVQQSTQQNPLVSISHFYPAAGNYFATLKVIASNGCRDSVRKNIYILSKPKANFSYTKNCLQAQTQFTDISTQDSSFAIDSIVFRQWKFDNQTVSYLRNPNYLFSSVGAHTVQLIVRTLRGCADTIVKTIQVKAPPLVSFTKSASAGDPPLIVQFTSTSSIEVNQFNWNFGDAGTSNLQNPTHTYSDAGNFVITLIGTDTSGCVNTASQTIFVKPAKIDIVVLSVSNSIDAENYLHVKADIQNKSTRIITSIDLYNRVNGESGIKETWQGVLPINGSMTYAFSAAPKLLPDERNNYVCVEARRPNFIDDYFPNDNENCASFTGNVFLVSNPYPNPALTEVILPVILPEEGTVLYKLYDNKGSLIEESNGQLLPKGLSQIQLNISSLRSGFYAIQFTYKDKSIVKRFIKHSVKQ